MSLQTRHQQKAQSHHSSHVVNIKMPISQAISAMDIKIFATRKPENGIILISYRCCSLVIHYKIMNGDVVIEQVFLQEETYARKPYLQISSYSH